jgi:hypothetical protein
MHSQYEWHSAGTAIQYVCSCSVGSSSWCKLHQLGRNQPIWLQVCVRVCVCTHLYNKEVLLRGRAWVLCPGVSSMLVAPHAVCSVYVGNHRDVPSWEPQQLCVWLLLKISV